jgi:hypothetical protein
VHGDVVERDADAMTGESSTEWYWDLGRGRAVPAAERGPGDRVLGPYPTKAAAEDWRRTVDERNDAWDDADEAWEADGADDAAP